MASRMMRFGLVAAALVAGSAATSAAVLVVRSSGPSAGTYPPGKAIPESTTLKLRANDMIVLLDSRGTRTLKGPGSFSASAAAGPSATASNNRRSSGIEPGKGLVQEQQLGVVQGAAGNGRPLEETAAQPPR